MGAFKVYNTTTSQWEYAKTRPANSTLVNGASVTGLVNSTNKEFTTPTPFVFINVYKNGVRMREGVGNDYTISGNNKIVFTDAPATGSIITVDYGTVQEQMIQGSNSTISDEVPTGVVDGTNKLYTAARGYISGTLQVWINGIKQQRGVHFAETNPAAGTFTMDEAPLTGDNVLVAYQFVVSVAGNADTLDGLHADDLMKKLYPVGTIYTNKTNATNPATLFGFGTWVALEGRVVVGKSASGTFATAGATGGAETHTLTTNEMPSHTHSSRWRVNFPKGNFNGFGTNDLGGDALLVSDNMPGGDSSAGYDWSGGQAANLNTGGGAAHNNLQPYVVAYMWERTA